MEMQSLYFIFFNICFVNFGKTLIVLFQCRIIYLHRISKYGYKQYKFVSLKVLISFVC